MAEQNNHPSMDWSAPDQCQTLAFYKQRCELFFAIKNIKRDKQVEHILYYSGQKGLEKFNSWDLTEEQKKNPDVIWEKFRGQSTTENFRICRMNLQKFMQKDGETIDDFIMRCRLQAQKCKFRDEDEKSERVIDQIILGTKLPDLQKELLGKKGDLTLNDTIELCKNHAASEQHMRELTNVASQSSSAYTPVNFIRKARQSSGGPSRPKCYFCGGEHAFQPREVCPAYGTTCRCCGKQNHFSSVCKSSRGSSRSQTQFKGVDKNPHSYAPRHKSHAKNVDCMNSEPICMDMFQDCMQSEPVDMIQDTFNHLTLDTMQTDIISHDAEAYTYIQVKVPCKRTTADIRIKVDTGAQGNTIPIRMYRKLYPENIDGRGQPKPGALQHRNTILSAYNSTTIPQYGTIRLPCKHGQQPWTDNEFYIVESDGPAILSYHTSLKMKLITTHFCITESSSAGSDPAINSIEDLKKIYPKQFDGMGNFAGEYHIVLKPDAQPVVHAPRKCSIHIKEELKQELNTMEDQGVICKVLEPSDWVSSLVVTRKSSGKLRICLDPKDLNMEIKRCHYKTPTLEEITHKFVGAKVFSTLDAKNGYWSVKLDDESSLLTTFHTPFGRYRYLRMPFGLVMSQDVFQQKMDQILDRCTGIVGVADDIAVFGSTTEEHDTNLHNLMKVAAQHGLVFNSEKCVVKQSTITFFGMVYDANGAHPDPGKVDDINNLTPPNNKTQLQEFLGLANYMAPFTPKLSDLTAPLRDLLKKDAEFVWTGAHTKAFANIKAAICKETTLAFFDPNKDTVIRVDASLRGIGAVLLQDNKPISFASKSLTDVEQRYANIERELLAVVYGCERFHTYIYGKKSGCGE